MLSYKLVKQLKKAGFPQEVKEGDSVYYFLGEKEYDYEWVPITKEEKRMIEIGAEGVMNAFNGSAMVMSYHPDIDIIDGVECKKVYKDTFKIIRGEWKKLVLISDEDDGEWWLNGNYIKIPILSELIEACGDKFINVGINPFPRPEKFMASGSIKEGKNDIFGKNEFGQTPEEAVANLWLELNKK